jgi:hypothetical protein
MPERKICFEVVLPDESCATSRQLDITDVSARLFPALENFLLERIRNYGWWNSEQAIDSFEVSGIRLILHRKNPLL